MKAILVIDEPKCCGECRLYDNGVEGCCLVSDVLPSREKRWKERDSDCPLKPLPEKDDYVPKDDRPYSKAEIMAYTYGIAVGRNQVIDEILGETE